MWLEQFATEGVGQKVRDMSSGLYSKSLKGHHSKVSS